MIVFKKDLLSRGPFSGSTAASRRRFWWSFDLKTLDGNMAPIGGVFSHVVLTKMLINLHPQVKNCWKQQLSWKKNIIWNIWQHQGPEKPASIYHSQFKSIWRAMEISSSWQRVPDKSVASRCLSPCPPCFRLSTEPSLEKDSRKNKLVL